MSTKCRVWSPDDQDEEEAEEIEVLWLDGVIAAESAAEIFCESKHSDWDHPKEFDVRVRIPSGAVFAVSVEVDWSPNFYASAKPITEGGG